jgi:hypothetical protein
MTVLIDGLFNGKMKIIKRQRSPLSSTAQRWDHDDFRLRFQSQHLARVDIFLIRDMRVPMALGQRTSGSWGILGGEGDRGDIRGIPAQR